MYLEVTFYFVVIRPTFSVLEAYVISFVISSTLLDRHSGQGWPLLYGVFLTVVVANAHLSTSSGHKTEQHGRVGSTPFSYRSRIQTVFFHVFSQLFQTDVQYYSNETAIAWCHVRSYTWLTNHVTQSCVCNLNHWKCCSFNKKINKRTNKWIIKLKSLNSRTQRG
jgi:hypothetical protein